MDKIVSAVGGAVIPPLLIHNSWQHQCKSNTIFSQVIKVVIINVISDNGWKLLYVLLTLLAITLHIELKSH